MEIVVHVVVTYCTVRSINKQRCIDVEERCVRNAVKSLWQQCIDGGNPVPNWVGILASWRYTLNQNKPATTSVQTYMVLLVADNISTETTNLAVFNSTKCFIHKWQLTFAGCAVLCHISPLAIWTVCKSILLFNYTNFLNRNNNFSQNSEGVAYIKAWLTYQIFSWTPTDHQHTLTFIYTNSLTLCHCHYALMMS